jgi:transposase
LRDSKVFYTVKCTFCGTEFSCYGDKNRKYCSHKCYIDDRFGCKNSKGNPEKSQKEAISLYESGHSYGLTAELTYYHNAQTADQWRSILRKKANRNARLNKLPPVDIDAGPDKIILVCGATNTNKGAQSLAIIVQGNLGRNPFSDDVFVFCAGGRHQLKYIKWDGGSFLVCSRTLPRGRFPWPGKELGKSITISEREFNFLLSGAKPKRHQEMCDYSDVILL